MTADVRDTTSRRSSSPIISIAVDRDHRQTRQPSRQECLRNSPHGMHPRRQEVAATSRRSPSAADGRIDARAHTATAREASGVLVAVARQGARDTERDRRTELTSRRQLLYDSFALARRHTPGALAAVSADTMLINAAASRLLTAHDRARLWAWASHHEARGTHGAPIRMTSGLVVDATAQLLHAGSQTVGAVIHLTIHREQPSTVSSRSPSPQPRFGWASLTDAEWGVAEQVATGLTNRQVASALYLSPHTVDAHLRRIYTKLGITSRVQLAYVLLTGTDPSTTQLPLLSAQA
jgi:DNA-binding NarL/FixJ family response regulator